MSRRSSRGSYDKEKGVTIINTEVHTAEDAPDRVIAQRFGSFGPLLSKLFKSGVEARGVERVPEHQRDTKNFWNRSVSSPSDHLRAARSLFLSLFMWWYDHPVDFISLLNNCIGRSTWYSQLYP